MITTRMQHYLLPLAIAAITSSLSAQADRFFVDATRPMSGNGLSWGMAFRTVQEALAVATTGQQVWVAAGTYAGGFTVPPGVVLLGGFRAGHTRLTQRVPTENTTLLDGEDRQRVLTLGDASLVDGFTIARGNAPAPGGGGALADGTSPVILNCLFIANRNSGGRGSALAVYNNGAPRVENCVFAGNNGAGHVIDVNTAGGIYRNLVVADNFSNGLHFQAGSSPRIENCAFVNNTGLGLCHISVNDTPTLHHCLIFNNAGGHIFVPTGVLRTIEAVNALAYARNNISVQPLFVNPTMLDYRVAATSPVIDAGVGTLWNDAPDDLFGNARVLDGDLNGQATIDIGVHEVTNVTLTAPRFADRGMNFTLALSGRAGLPAAVILGTNPTSAFLPPFGHLRLSPAGVFVLLPIGTLPASTTLPIPSTLALGAPLYWQGVALGAMSGNLTGLVDVTVR